MRSGIITRRGARRAGAKTPERLTNKGFRLIINHRLTAWFELIYEYKD